MKYNICLVTEDFNEGRGGYILKKNLIKVLTEINDSKIIVIDSNFYIPKQFILLKLISILIIQLKNTIKLLKNLKNINVVIFTSGATFILPMFFSKISNKTTIYFISGLTGNELKKVSNIIYKNSIFGLGGVVLSNLFFFFENILIKLADNIILESPSIKNNNFYLSKLNKPVFNGSLFIDTYKFYPKNNFKFRKPIICFFGALTKYKGINVLLNSIPIILSNEDVIFYIIG
jgi:glycosyltransferase involved in cell wall biosynthesis